MCPERAEAARGQEAPQADLDPGGLPEGRSALATRLERWRHRVARVVLAEEPVDVGFGGCANGGHKVVDAKAVDAGAEPDLGLDLVAFGDGNVAHVVPEAGKAKPPELVHAAGGP